MNRWQWSNKLGYTPRRIQKDRIVEFVPAGGGASIMLHPAAKSVKTGQVTVKLVFDVKDVEQFRNQCLKRGLKFGAIHMLKGESGKGDDLPFAVTRRRCRLPSAVTVNRSRI